MKMKTHPSVISKICHHVRRREPPLITAGESIPVIEGSGTGTDVPDTCGTETRSERHSPRPGTTAVAFPPQLAATQDPPRRTEVEVEHARQLLGPEPEQLEQLLSHA